MTAPSRRLLRPANPAKRRRVWLRCGFWTQRGNSSAAARVVPPAFPPAQIADRGEQLMQCECCTAVGKYYWCENSIHIYCDQCIVDVKTPLAWYWVERMRQRLAPANPPPLIALSMSSSSKLAMS